MGFAIGFIVGFAVGVFPQTRALVYEAYGRAKAFARRQGWTA